MTSTPEDEDAPAAVTESTPLTLEQWAKQTSSVDRRVELLNAFVALQRNEGRFTGTTAIWNELYAQFAARPV